VEIMTEMLRRSPVSFKVAPARTEVRDGWNVVLEYEGEGKGPYLIDLSHSAKWDVQDIDLSKFRPWGLSIPETPGQCTFQDGISINRMNRTQAACWHLCKTRVQAPGESAYTETTDATLLLALLGKEVFSVLEMVSALDFLSPRQKPPFLLQGPILHVPCQVVCLGRDNETAAVFFTCSRGYGESMTEGILSAGREWGLRPAGENVVTNWLQGKLT
jgi:hypothetical protein